MSKSKLVLVSEIKASPLLLIIEDLLINMDGEGYYSSFHTKLREALTLSGSKTIYFNMFVRELKPLIESFIKEANKKRADRPCEFSL